MIAEVIPFIRLPREFGSFSYQIPNDWEANLLVGQCVQIPFRNKKILGIVLEIKKETTRPLRPLEKIINPVPLLDSAYLNYLKNLAVFYGVSLSRLIPLAFPPLQPKKISQELVQPWRKKTSLASKPEYNWYKTKLEHEAALAVNENESCAIIVPELARVSEVFVSLSERRRQETEIWSAEIPPKEQCRIWFAIRNGQVKTLIATRSGIWLPLTQSFDRIIIDYEHKENHKHWDQTPRYHTKDLAKLMCKNWHLSYAEMSYSPSVTSYYFIDQKKYEARVSKTQLDTPIILQQAPSYETGLIFHGAIEHLRQNLVPNSDILIMYSRREAVEPAQNFRSTIETIATEINQKITAPNYETHCVTSDTLLPQPTALPRILIGTRALLNNPSWSRARAIIWLDFDNQLLFPEYRTEENVWHTVHDILFYKNPTASFIIQTSLPEHRIFNGLNNSADWYNQEIKAREQLGYPPFTYLVRYIIMEKNKKFATTQAEACLASLRLTQAKKKNTIQGSIETSINLKNNVYSQVIMLKISEADILTAVCQANIGVPGNVKIDPHPISLLSSL